MKFSEVIKKYPILNESDKLVHFIVGSYIAQVVTGLALLLLKGALWESVLIGALVSFYAAHWKEKSDSIYDKRDFWVTVAGGALGALTIFMVVIASNFN